MVYLGKAPRTNFVSLAEKKVVICPALSTNFATHLYKIVDGSVELHEGGERTVGFPGPNPMARNKDGDGAR